MENDHFADRLIKAIGDKKTALMVGLDPRMESLPDVFRRSDSEDTTYVAAAIQQFCRCVIDVVADLVPAVKPQAAFFEQLGPFGMQALASVIDYARESGLIVILDGKRNDIGSTATAYAEAYLGKKPQSVWGCDALTINPYLGDDSLEPMIQRAEDTGSGLFALVKTSNPGSSRFQELTVGTERLYQVVGRWVQALASDHCGNSGYGLIGAVVGATHPDHLAELRASMPNTFFLVPGFGAQGGSAQDVAAAFDEKGTGAIINSSRQIIFAYKNQQYADVTDWQVAIELATQDAIEQLRVVCNR